MSSPSHKTSRALKTIEATNNLDALKNSVQHKIPVTEAFDRLPDDREFSQKSANKKIGFLQKETGTSLTHLSGKKKITTIESLQGNIENFIGFTQVPTGIIGPLKVVGSAAKGAFLYRLLLPRAH